MKTAIMTDENSGLTVSKAQELGVFLMKMPFFVNGQMKYENVDMTKKEFYEALKNKAEVSTSQPSPGDVMDMWREILREYDGIVYIPMSSGLSQSCQSAIIFAEEFDGKVQVADNHRISVTMEQSVYDAVNLAKQGLDAKQIRERLEAEAYDASIYITVEDLYYLKRGGRVTAAGAALGTLLNLKPVLEIAGDKLDAYAKARGMVKARHVMVEAMKKDFAGKLKPFVDAGNIQLCISYSDVNEETLESWTKEVQEAFPGYSILTTPLSLSIGCHIGPGALAIAACRVD